MSLNEIEVQIDTTIKERLWRCIIDYQTKYQYKPKALLLGPQEYKSLEFEFSKSHQRYFHVNQVDSFEGVPLYMGPIHGIMPIGDRDSLWPMTNELRKKCEGLH